MTRRGDRSLRIVLTGGGTGGHIYPALAVAESVRRREPSAEIAWLGGSTGPEREIVPAAGLPFQAVTTRKLGRIASPETVLVLLALARGWAEARKFLRRFRPDVLISAGGYVAGAAVLAAARQRLPVVVLAGDAVPGRTNRFAARRATRVCIWFEETADLLPSRRCVPTGWPIRRGVVSTQSPEAARGSLGLDPGRPTVVAVGGSQGARRLNELVLEALSELPGRAQVLHHTGIRNIEEVRAAAAGRGFAAAHHPRAALSNDEMAMAYRAADVLVCRCGITTLAEMTAAGCAALMVPLPTAYADHQTANALAIERRGAGILLPEPQLTGHTLAARLVDLLEDAPTRESLSRAALAASRPRAADQIAELACSLPGGG